MTTSAEEILMMLTERRSARSPVIARMAEIRDHYNGEITVPLPELDKNEKAAVANLITQGLDQMAMRIASVLPSIVYPPTKVGNDTAERYARIRRLANYGWWQKNRFARKQRKRARWLIGYSTAPVIIRPNEALHIPRWELRDPLNTYPGSTGDGDDLSPPDCIFVFRRSLRWLTHMYPDQVRLLDTGRDADPDMLYEVAEWVDHEEHVSIIVSKPRDGREADHNLWMPQSMRPQPRGAAFVEIERTPNRAGRCTAVVPTRVTLDRPMGQFDGMPGLYAMQARAMALWLISSERAIFPDTWFVSRPNETVRVLEQPDGRAGIPGQVSGGDLREITVAPPPATAQIVDLLERNQRVGAGIPSDFGGESASNVRTGRRADTLLGSTVDFWVQEAQETLAEAYCEENKVAVAVVKAYFGNDPHSFYVSWSKASGQVDYVPNRHFDTDNNLVTFPHPGSDVNSLIIGIGQRLGIEEMSTRTAQELDPLIDDPELEHDRILSQQLEKSLMTAIDQAVVSGQLGPLEVGHLAEMVSGNKMSVWAAVQKLHKETQDAQAQSQGQGPGGVSPLGGPPPGPGAGQPGLPPGGGGGQPGPPGIMSPGIQQTLGVGPQNPPGEAVGPPSPSLAHMGQLFSALRPRSNG